MAVEGCTKCLKWLLFAFNVFFFSIGVIILALGAWLYVEFDSFLDELAGVKYLNGPILFMVVGSIITVLSFLGCCGACLEKKVLLYLFASLMIVTFILELVGGILAVTNDYDKKLEDSLTKSLSDYEKKDALREAWDTVQKNLDCCGVNNKTDWEQRLTQPKTVPESCCRTELCKTMATGEPKVVPSNRDVYNIGCYKKIKDEYEGNTVAVAAVGITFAVVQILGIIFACCVACKIDSSPEVVWNLEMHWRDTTSLD